VNLLVIRHGQTDYNAQRRFQGQADIPLNDNGRDQARRAALILETLLRQSEALKNSHTTHPITFFVSDLLRTQQTADIVLPILNDIPVQKNLEERLREFHCGLFENSTYEEFVREYPDISTDYMNAYDSDHYATPYPGAGGESRKHVMRRVGEVLKTSEVILRKSELVVWIVHGGVIDVMLELMHIQLPKAGPDRISAGNGDVLQFALSDGTKPLSEISLALGHTTPWRLLKHYKIGSTVAARVVQDI
jgi:probable phosphoglycerate mutase